MAKKNIKLGYLKGLASKKDIDIGVSVCAKFLDNKIYRELVRKEFSILTPEDEMKFLTIHPIRNKYNFSLADKIISFAKRNKIKVRGHTLVWYHETGLPKWISDDKFTREELIEILKGHIARVVGHYKGELYAWDVVNEAIDDDCKLRKGAWLDVIGPEYIEMAFRFAHKADPNVKLYYNDYGIDDLNKKSDRVYKLIKNLLKKGTPIHGIGLQMHLSEENSLNPRSVEKNIRRFKKLGLEVSITEMDVRIKEPITKNKLMRQAVIYGEIMKIALKTKCKAFVMWGVSDANSWIPEWFKKYDAPLIFDKKYKPKFAYWKVKDVLR